MISADGTAARIIAFLVFLTCAAALAWFHRDDLMPRAAGPALVENVPLANCLSERVGAVDKMRSEGVVNETQYAAFRKRAEDFCHGQFGSNGPPPLTRP